jgi:hypothetical protein
VRSAQELRRPASAGPRQSPIASVSNPASPLVVLPTGVVDQATKQVQVHLVVGKLGHIPRRATRRHRRIRDTGIGEGTPQPGHIAVQAAHDGCGHLGSPDALDKDVDTNRPAHID